MLVDFAGITILRREQGAESLPKDSSAHLEDGRDQFVRRGHDKADEEINENNPDRDVEYTGVKHLIPRGSPPPKEQKAERIAPLISRSPAAQPVAMT
jgi:hypothetical protein